MLKTAHGLIPTPIFMPVGTLGTVKGVLQQVLADDIKAKIILGNTYHLYLRPGDGLIRELGGLHAFSGWRRPILTDSGGYQVFSLAELRKINDEGVRFQSHIDGSAHTFTPESVVDIQRNLGSDVMMALDECAPYPCEYEEAKRAHERTLGWAKRAAARFRGTESPFGFGQLHFGIVQGGVHETLRMASLEVLTETEFDGYAIGGLAVGEPRSAMMEITGLCTEHLPAGQARYLMGVGKPEDIVDAIALGVDMFDCVIPTRNGRNGTFYTRDGKLVIRNQCHRQDSDPVEDGCRCYACRNFSRAYLRHLFNADEILGLQLATLHNLTFYTDLAGSARQAVLEGTFDRWKASFYSRYRDNNE